MKELEGRTAFITGGASGIGLGIALALGQAGMNIAIGDIEGAALEAALGRLRARQIKAEGFEADVTSRASLRTAALGAVAAFGKVHVLCNNAGVSAVTSHGKPSVGDWDWTLDVNLLGVVHGAEVFVPLMESHGEGGHLLNTGSLASLIVSPGSEPYTASKFGVIALSEGWAEQLKPRGIGVSVLCPGFVNTNIHSSERNRGRDYGAPSRVAPAEDVDDIRRRLAEGLSPDIVGRRVVEGLRNDELYIFTHAGEFREMVIARYHAILAGFERSRRSPALSRLPERALPGAPPAPNGR